MRRLELASAAVDRRLEQELAPEGVSLLEAHTLLVIAEVGRMRLGDLRRNLGRQGSTMTGLLDRLVAKGLLSRVAAERDRRAWDVALTDEGRRVATTLRRHVAALEWRIGARMAPEARESLLSGLDVIADVAGDDS